MKKVIMAFLAVGLLVAGCKDKIENKNAVVTNENSEQSTLESYDNFKSIHFIKDCDSLVYWLSEKRHHIKDSTDFDSLARAHSHNPDDSRLNLIFSPGYTLAKMDSIFKSEKTQCYDGWMEVQFDTTKNIVRFSRSDIYDNRLCLYSEPLFQGIAAILDSLKATDAKVFFTPYRHEIKRKGNPEKRDGVGFKIEYKIGTSKGVRFYDMSDDPL